MKRRPVLFLPLVLFLTASLVGAQTDVAAWRGELGLDEGAPVFVAGSTLAEDEGPALDAVATLRGAGIDLRLVIAPRRQERVAEVERACRERAREHALRTDGGTAPVLVLNSDVLFPADLARVLETHAAHDAVATMVLRAVPDAR